MGILNWFGGGKTLYFPGCLTKGVLLEQFENYKEIFNRLGIDFVMLSKDEVCCGLPVLNAGYRKDAKKLAKKNFDLFKKNGIRKIITNCPSCYHMFREIYPDMVREWDIEVEHATVTICERLRKLRIRVTGDGSQAEVVAYHDPCHLGRFSGIYEEPREVIERLGGRVFEFELNRKDAICCGAGGGMRANFPEVAKKIAAKKMSFVPEEVVKVVSPCGLCYANFASGIAARGDGRQVTGDRGKVLESVEFSDFVVRKLRGLR